MHTHTYIGVMGWALAGWIGCRGRRGYGTAVQLHVKMEFNDQAYASIQYVCIYVSHMCLCIHTHLHVHMPIN